MMKLAIGLALLILAALLAAVGWVLARPRWRWDPPLVDEVEPSCRVSGTYISPPIPGIVYSTGSPWSVTSRADNGTGFDPRLLGS